LLPLADMVHDDVAEAAWRRVGATEEGVKDLAMGRPMHMRARSLEVVAAVIIVLDSEFRQSVSEIVKDSFAESNSVG